MDAQSIESKFKQAMIPAMLMGVVVNIYIIIALVIINRFSVLITPIFCVGAYLFYFILLRSDKINAKNCFLLGAYTAVVEVVIHTHFLGWDTGFYYYLFLLPILFLLNSSWKTWIIIFFNSSIAIAISVLWLMYQGRSNLHLISPEATTIFNLFNLIGLVAVVMVVMVYFRRTLHKKDEALVEANSILERQNKEISGQHQHSQILLKEVHHRVKNNLQIISSLMSLQRRTIEDRKAADILNESSRRIEAIALIHHKLYQDKEFNSVDFKSYLEEIMESQHVMNPHVKCTVESVRIVLDLDKAVPLGLIISEMITNSMKHAFDKIESPELKVILTNTENYVELLVQDNGVGFSENFDFNEPASLGIEIISALSDQIDAKMECFNNKNGGASFKIVFQNKPVKD